MEAILGGTFDPVHVGHLHAARVGRAALNLASVTMVLAARPGHRSLPVASIEERWRMLCLATAGRPELCPSDLEMARSGPSYTVDTLRAIDARRPLVWLIGRDALDDIASWHRAGDLPSLCHLLVLDRPGGSRSRPVVPRGFELVGRIGELADHPAGCMHCLPDAMPAVSASQVRRAIAEGSDASALLPGEVWSYIRQRGLYGPTRSPRGTD